eukprot:920772-Ditylum_brightwellii.AAC.1
MHRPNRTHSTKDCFELKQHAKRAKADTNRGGADKVDNSSNEESNHEVNALAAASNDDSDSNASCVLSNESRSNS